LDEISALETHQAHLESCTQSLNEVRASFENGYGEYEQQSTTGYCVRSTDNANDFDNMTEMYETSESVYDCAVSCNADPTCVAFDYETSSGFCYAYKSDPLASYVGNGDPEWSCYTHISIPSDCGSIYQETVAIVANIYLVEYNQNIQIDGLQIDKDALI
jgi:hypothetical protein